MNENDLSIAMGFSHLNGHFPCHTIACMATKKFQEYVSTFLSTVPGSQAYYVSLDWDRKVYSQLGCGMQA